SEVRARVIFDPPRHHPYHLKAHAVAFGNGSRVSHQCAIAIEGAKRIDLRGYPGSKIRQT
ncbi:hypothetical protein RYZ18_14175, partial [Roseovarius sp. 10]|uniref:hypothetical protein n=1 Tax=Roseovarius sp. 10 TaxID=3080563 RepID=UPI0029556108